MIPKLVISPAAVAEWQRLNDAFETFTPSCRFEPDAWFDKTPGSQDERDDIAAVCMRCPVISLCHAYAEAAAERHGCWAGIWRDPHKNRTRTSQVRKDAA